VVALGALGAAAMNLGAVERAEALLESLDAGERVEHLLGRIRAPFPGGTKDTAHSVESLRANRPPNLSDSERAAAPAAGEVEPVRSRDITETEATRVVAASQQAAAVAPMASATKRAHTDPTVPRSNTPNRSTAAGASAGMAIRTPATRARSTRNAPEGAALVRTPPRVTASDSKLDGAVKAPRRSKARAPARKPSRKAGQAGIIRQSPF
jgi:hypothetical protein